MAATVATLPTEGRGIVCVWSGTDKNVILGGKKILKFDLAVIAISFRFEDATKVRRRAIYRGRRL